MPTFMILGRFTDETAASFAARPPVQSAADIAQKLGDLAHDAPLNGSLAHLFFTAGEHELVVVLDMPNQRQAVAYALAMTRMLGVRTTTVPAFDATDFAGVIDDSSKVDGA